MKGRRKEERGRGERRREEMKEDVAYSVCIEIQQARQKHKKAKRQ
jgi:hypothetical protein